MATKRTASPYDLNAAAMRKIRQRERQRINKPRDDSRIISPYDLTAHGGLAALTTRVSLRRDE